MKPRLLLVMLVAIFCTAAAAVVASAGTGHHPKDRDHHQRGSYEVWLVDQEDRFNAGAGTLYVFDGPELTRDTASALPETVALAGSVRTMCSKTERSRAPHMIVFNGGDTTARRQHHARGLVASGSGLFSTPTARALDDRVGTLPRRMADPQTSVT